MSSENSSADPTMPATPAHPIAAATGAGNGRERRCSARATRPPTASSHARVCSEKNAHGCDAEVCTTHAANDSVVTTARTRKRERRVRRTPVRAMSTIGHTR